MSDFDETGESAGEYEILDDSDLLRPEMPQIQDFDAHFAAEREDAEAQLGAGDEPAAEEDDVRQRLVVDFALEPTSAIYDRGTHVFATERNSGRRFFLGTATQYEQYRGLAITGHNIHMLESPKYNRLVEEPRIGLWAHFIAPTVTAESFGGLHLLVNSYDRAAFTFGFYQLAAHTPKDNLILLFRALIKLPNAPAVFPDLAIGADGRLQQNTASGVKDLEKEADVTLADGRVERQITQFMAYLNPTVRAAEKQEAANAAKLMHWVLNDPAAMDAAVRIPFEIMRKKARRINRLYDLQGIQPEIAIWVSDITHQGRGGPDKIRDALRQSTFEKKLQALERIDRYPTSHPNGRYEERRRTVKTIVQKLRDENRFDGVKFGESALLLDPIS
jgi:hypothetical protein